MNVKRDKPVTQEREIELARKKLFKKMKQDRAKRKQVVSKVMKKHCKKPPTAPAGASAKPVRPKTAKNKEIVVDENNENDYEKFINGKILYSCNYIKM